MLLWSVAIEMLCVMGAVALPFTGHLDDLRLSKTLQSRLSRYLNSDCPAMDRIPYGEIDKQMLLYRMLRLHSQK